MGSGCYGFDLFTNILVVSKEVFNDDDMKISKKMEPLESVMRSFKKIVLRSLRWPSTVKSVSSVPLPLQPFSVSISSGSVIEFHVRNLTSQKDEIICIVYKSYRSQLLVLRYSSMKLHMILCISIRDKMIPKYQNMITFVRVDDLGLFLRAFQKRIIK